MIRWEGVATFVAVAEEGSISAAARRLGLAKSIVSERLAELEKQVGARLIQRTTRKSSLTETGTSFLSRGKRLLREADDAIAEIAEGRSELVGPLRISAPVSFGALHLGPALYPFLLQNPRIELALELDDRFVDAAADGFDLVIRHGRFEDRRLISRRLTGSRRVLVASPAYLRRATPHSPADLGAHRAILYANRDADWRFVNADDVVTVRTVTALRVNNGLMMRDAAVSGLGIALLPTFLVYREVAAGVLEVIDIGLEAEAVSIIAAWPRERSVSAKVIRIVDQLRTAFGEPAYWDAEAR